MIDQERDVEYHKPTWRVASVDMMEIDAATALALFGPHTVSKLSFTRSQYALPTDALQMDDMLLPVERFDGNLRRV